jgi:5-formyltetrahydrofolate cyclo-ligase
LNKLAIRKKFRDLRSAIPESVRTQASANAARLLAAHPVFQSSRNIAAYIAYKSEFDTSLLIDAILNAGKHCYLPILTDGKSLNFARYQRNDELQPNQYSIPEPVGRLHLIHADKLDLVLTPLVAFDKTGSRIGTGGGYYDRTFAFLYADNKTKPFMLGVGYDMQQCDAIEREPWDINLNGVLTESGITIF